MLFRLLAPALLVLPPAKPAAKPHLLEAPFLLPLLPVGGQLHIFLLKPFRLGAGKSCYFC
ncbi:rCG30416 [Rattus norvegicus]|uniref:RCG30416 n=1 Tax=Rattus norvegicus TaxID=10116 RepID=A6JFL2_RAT|nr:rCG30416 [Rattus norvegicus]